MCSVKRRLRRRQGRQMVGLIKLTYGISEYNIKDTKAQCGFKIQDLRILRCQNFSRHLSCGMLKAKGLLAP